MSLPKRAEQPKLSTALDEVFAQVRLKAWDVVGASAKSLNVIAEADGTLRGQAVLYDGTSQVRRRAEATGEARNVPVLWDGSALIRQAAESAGEAKSSLYGTDSDSNLDPLRTNASQQLQVEVTGAMVSELSNLTAVMEQLVFQLGLITGCT